ncbi:site-specific integrase [Pseudomonas aeruginosa]
MTGSASSWEESVSISAQPHIVEQETFLSRDGYVVEFYSERWLLSKDVDIPIGALCSFFPGNAHNLRRVLEFYAKNASPSHTKNLSERLGHYVKSLQGGTLFSVESILSYRSSLEKVHEWYLGSVRVLMRQWHRLGYPGISQEVLELLDNLVIKGNEKGRAVQSMCPDDGPLTDIEMQGVVEAATYAFSRQTLCLEDTCLLMMLAMTGRRPAQISALKIKDLSPKNSGKYFVDFPRAKQRGLKWRSAFKRFSILEDLWLLLQQQADQVRKDFASALKVGVVSSDFDGDLPLFPNMKSFDPRVEVRELLNSDRLHISSLSIYTRVKETAELLNVVSERTGAALHLSPNRFRYTLGTNLAREGKGEYVIAEALDHSDTQNSGVYVKNIPDIVKRIDLAVALQLAPIAQAFRGVLVSSENEAQRGNDPSSRISNGRANVGTCGSYGFCGALAPIACYSCAHFQPWINGPHEEVLMRLLEDRDRVAEQTGDIKVASANDRLILAVSDVIHRCKVARGEAVNG